MFLKHLGMMTSSPYRYIFDDIVMMSFVSGLMLRLEQVD